MITIRKSTASDGDRVLSIWRASVDATHDFLSHHDRQEIEKMLHGFLPSAPLLLAVDPSQGTVGFMLVANGHLEALFVHPACFGAGVGRQLVEHALALHPGLTTDVNEQNSKALGFYQRLGFVQTGRSEIDGQGRPYPLIHLKHRL
ncbi:acetyltransferase [Rhizobium halophilum]|uniref:acetyltransferase n=1 Tax=Rhizobium halophilum TaxID=2846852 RepID=UPI001EFE0773|nr:acetyltransferase [Rhizobium halophilum]MCF6371073.1 acetyltransferase [Rhizobium halophilum]